MGALKEISPAPLFSLADYGGKMFEYFSFKKGALYKKNKASQVLAEFVNKKKSPFRTTFHADFLISI